jgi:hypothetical protein
MQPNNKLALISTLAGSLVILLVMWGNGARCGSPEGTCLGPIGSRARYGGRRAYGRESAQRRSMVDLRQTAARRRGGGNRPRAAARARARRARRGGIMRSRHSRSAEASPSSASSTARLVSASASPSSTSSAASVALLRTSMGRPFGLPDRPLRNRPLAARPTCSCTESTGIDFSLAVMAPTFERGLSRQSTMRMWQF